MWILFSIEKCPYCQRLKQLLQKKKIPFYERSLSTSQEDRTLFKTCTGKTTAPQLGWTDVEDKR